MSMSMSISMSASISGNTAFDLLVPAVSGGALAGAKQYKMKFSITDSQTRKSKFLPVLRLGRGKSVAVVLCQVTQILELECETAFILWLM
jgi:hypothetical protein